MLLLMVLTCALWSYSLGLCSSLHRGGLECFPFKFHLDGPKCSSYEFSCLDGLELVLIVLSVFHFHFVSMVESLSWWS
jgi:hypothetical protein